MGFYKNVKLNDFYEKLQITDEVHLDQAFYSPFI